MITRTLMNRDERLIFYRADKTVTKLLREGWEDVRVVTDEAGTVPFCATCERTARAQTHLQTQARFDSLEAQIEELHR